MAWRTIAIVVARESHSGLPAVMAMAWDDLAEWWETAHEVLTPTKVP